MSVRTKIQNFMRNAWARVVAFFVLRQLRVTPDSPLDFDRLFTKPEDWLLVMPVEANAFDVAMSHCRKLQEHLQGVRLHLLVPYEFRHWVRTAPDLKVHPFHRQDLFLGRIPRSMLLQRLHRLGPTVAVDLSPWPTPLSLCACGLSGARIRGSLSRAHGDDIFNFLVKTRAGDIGERYRALFAYLA